MDTFMYVLTLQKAKSHCLQDNPQLWVIRDRIKRSGVTLTIVEKRVVRPLVVMTVFIVKRGVGAS